MGEINLKDDAITKKDMKYVHCNELKALQSMSLRKFKHI